MMELTFRPIERWPGELTKNRKRSQFSASYRATIELLDSELAHLRAKSVVLQVAMTDADIRLDGLPRVKAKAVHPGIILAFESIHGSLSYPCDRFDKWEDNLRAIALSLQHLRAVDRYGVTKRGEQYKGWTALPDKSTRKMTKDDAHDYLRRHGYFPGCEEDAKKAFRELALRFHPDRGGDADEFKKAMEAKDALLGG